MPDFVLPVVANWDVDLGGPVSYPLISGGSVFVSVAVTANNATSNELYALNAKNGKVIWGPMRLPLTEVAGIAYDNGMIFVVGANTDIDISSRIIARSASTGVSLWLSDVVNDGWDFFGAPTPYEGYIYNQGGGYISCLKETDGSVVWTSNAYAGFGASSVSADGLYASSACGVTHRLDPLTGTVLWDSYTGCTGGGGQTCAYYNGNVFVHDYYVTDSTVFTAAAIDAITGKLAKSFPETSPQAFDNGLMIDVAQHEPTITATRLSDWSTAWTVTVAVDTPVTAPTIVNGIAYIGTSTGLLNGYDENTGALMTSVPLGERPSATVESATDLNAGDGLIVVPAGNHLVAVGTPFARMTATTSPASPNGSNGWYTKPVSVTLTTTAGTAYYTLDGGATQTYSAPITVTGDAKHTVTYWAQDSSGNITAKASLPIAIDGTAPKTSAKLSGPQLVSGSYAGMVYVTLNASDNLSGVASTSYSVDGGASQSYSTPFAVVGKGTHKVVYESVDKAGNTETANTLTVNIGAAVLHTFEPGLQMIAAPEDYTGSTIAQIFDTPIAFAAWDPASSAYAVAPTAPADTIRPGVGYWARIPAGGADLFDIGGKTDTSQPYKVALKSGWNMIGNPFEASFAVGALDVVSADGVTYPVGTAASIVAPTLYTWPAGATAYKPVQVTDGFWPFVGYWIYAYQPCTLVIPGTPAPPGSPTGFTLKAK